MGKSILILLILIIMLVAAPIFGSFGEVADKPVVVSSPSCSECFMKHHQNIEYQLEPSIAVPLKTAEIKSLINEEAHWVYIEIETPALGSAYNQKLMSEEIIRLNKLILKEQFMTPDVEMDSN